MLWKKEVKIEGTRRQRRRCKHLLDDLRKITVCPGYCDSLSEKCVWKVSTDNGEVSVMSIKTWADYDPWRYF
jgi:hypothetical protein